MTDKLSIVSQKEIQNRIYTIRDLQVMFDYHLASIYEVETKRLNEQVKRNTKRFPESFMFQLSQNEWDNLQSQFATTPNSENLQSQFATAKRRTLPYAFTEQGVSMLSAVLNSEHAILYHLGASLKDLGKKWFAFSKMDSLSNDVIAKLKR